MRLILVRSGKKYNPEVMGWSVSDSPRLNELLFGKVKEMINMLLVSFMFIFGTWVGWVTAYSTVSTECETQDSFYVGKKIYKCSEITDHK